MNTRMRLQLCSLGLAVLVMLSPAAFSEEPRASVPPEAAEFLQMLEQFQGNAEARAAVIDALRTRIDELKGEAASKPSPDTQAELDKKQAQAEELAAAVDDLSRELEEKRQQLSAVQEQIPQLESELATAKAQQEEAQSRLAVYEKSLAIVEALKAEKTAASEEAPVSAEPEAAKPDETPVQEAAVHKDDVFTGTVAPILQENCVRCHGARKQKGGLRLDAIDHVWNGGATGPVVIAGDPDGSRLIQALRYEGDLQMPPGGKLPQEQLDAIAAWVQSANPVTKQAAAEPEPEPAPAPAPKAEEVVEATPATGTPAISFNREIRPILSDKCYACHGPDKHTRKAGLRLDTEEGAFAALASGHAAIVRGDKSQSAIWHRITSDDANDQMPPPDQERQLTDAEIAKLGEWIDAGAPWQKHWAFIPPKRPALPEVAKSDWARTPIDNFVLARLEDEGVEPAPEADKRTLIRRVTLDLTGLPPTLAEVEAFVNDESPDAYEKLVDRLIASPQFGEHMARYWLDLARYADTNGYHIDNERYMWRWRDWVINAFNDNKPFDEFTVEQLAGDLMDNPTRGQLIATGFNRNHMINFEGGAIPEEYRVEYVSDRVETTGEVWMGLTVNCAKCHDHKFDPVSMEEYYQLFAFYNTIPEEGLDGRDGNAKPFIKAPLADQEAEMARLDKALEQVRTEAFGPIAAIDEAQKAWESDFRATLSERWTALAPKEVKSDRGSTFTVQDDGSVLVAGENPDKDIYEFTAETNAVGIAALKLEVLTDESLPEQGPGRSERSNFVLSELEVDVWPKDSPDQSRKVTFAQAVADYSQPDFDVSLALDGKAETGWAVEGHTRHENRTAVFLPTEPFGFPAGSVVQVRLKQEAEFAQHNIGRFRLSVTTDPALAPAQLRPWYVSGPYVAEDGATAYSTDYGVEGGVDLKATSADGRLKWVPAAAKYPDGQINELYGDIAATYLYREIQAPTARTLHLSLGSNDAIKVWLNGEVVHDNNVERGVEKDQDDVPVTLKQGTNALLVKVVNYGNAYAFYFNKGHEQLGEVPLDIELILAKTPDARSDAEARRLLTYYRRGHMPGFDELETKLAGLEEEKKELDAEIPTVMVMKQMEEPRETFVLARGQYDQPTDKVTAATPAVLPAMAEEAPRNRLGLAQWLVRDDHPLTARVAVNRYWQRYFGTGIVKTVEDFGVQGERPFHPDLLDWLAVEFVASGWDVKHMQKLMVMSAAYRQASHYRPELMERDPANRLIARGPRFRLDAEMVRDNALAVSGLLVEKVGGPSVKPYQPKGLWKEVAYGAGFTAQTFEPDTGDGLYRRSMYTFWKRQSPPPGMMLFDAPSREKCTAKRSRTNTPLQALALMNDTQYVEASRALAARMMQEGGDDPAARIKFGFELATARVPSDEECKVLMEVYEANLAEFNENAEGAQQLIAVGESKPPEGCAPTELAAYTTVASMILNLDETITKS